MLVLTANSQRLSLMSLRSGALCGLFGFDGAAAGVSVTDWICLHDENQEEIMIQESESPIMQNELRPEGAAACEKPLELNPGGRVQTLRLHTTNYNQM